MIIKTLTTAKNGATYAGQYLSLIHISEPTRQEAISYAVFCLKKKRRRRKPHLRVKIGLCGERKLNLLNMKMMLRGSLTSDKNK